MKALIQKDLKENLITALVGLLFFSLGQLAGYLSCVSDLKDLLSRHSSDQQWYNLQPLLSSDLLIASAIFCAIFGLALGWLQTRNEAHRDLWAFLIHRPVTRSEIFWSKAIAGLSLYIFAIGLPFAVLVAVVRVPGHIAAPFEWTMIVPMTSIMLTGIAFYFAGLLTGLRQARWYASRSYGLGLAVIAMLGIFTFEDCGWIFLWIAIAIITSAIAAWGAYQNGGFYRGQPMAGRLALVVAISCGCAIVLLAGTAVSVGLILNPLTQRLSGYGAYQMTRDGMIYQEDFLNNEVVAIHDWQGHPALNPKTGKKWDAKELAKHFAYGAMVSLKPQSYNAVYARYAAHFFTLINVTDKNLWFLDRHGKLTGYNGPTRKPIGSLDPHGYDGTLTMEAFLPRSNANYYYSPHSDDSRKLLPTAKTVYQIDFRNRTVTPIFTLTNEENIAGYENTSIGYEDPSQGFFLATHKKIYLIDDHGKTVLTMPYESSYPEYPQVEVTYLELSEGATNTLAVWFRPDFATNRLAGWKMPIHVLWIGPDQTVAKTTDLPSLYQSESVSLPDRIMPVLLPPVLNAVFDPPIITPPHFLGLALALILAGIGSLMARRYHFPARACIGWFLFICFLGITGLVTLLVTEEWPKRELCPYCKKLRTVDRESCEHCQSPFLSPEKNGTEIFAPLTKA